MANTVCMQNGLDLIENPLLGNNFTTLSQTWLEWSLYGPLSNLYLTALPSINHYKNIELSWNSHYIYHFNWNKLYFSSKYIAMLHTFQDFFKISNFADFWLYDENYFENIFFSETLVPKNNKLAGMSLDGPLSKLYPAALPSMINDRFYIKNRKHVTRNNWI